MPEMKKPRPPGSQVSPNPAHKPLHRPGPTATTHLRKPLDQTTHGKVYRVRDKDMGDGEFVVWGENLSYTEAFKLKEQVVAARKSKTARVEEMPADTADEMSPPPPNGDSFNKPADDPELEQARQKAVAAAAPVARAAQAKYDHKQVAMKDPPKPPPSPLSDELVDLPDGHAELPPDDEPLKPGDVQEIIADVGGGPGDNDKQHAEQLAETTVHGSVTKAMDAYARAVLTDKNPDTWPGWDELGQFEQAAWRYFADNGGKPPALTRTMRKVTHAMGGDQ